jgi:DNA-binding GntR family transcriptional regulator
MDLSGVARTTARRAVAVLRDEGLVVTTKGRGTHVTGRSSSADPTATRQRERGAGRDANL